MTSSSSSVRSTGHYSRHGRSVSGDNAPRMKPLFEGEGNVPDEEEGGAPGGAEGLRGTGTGGGVGRGKKMTRRYSLNEEKLRCMRVRQTSFEVISDDEMPQLGRVRTRRWSTSWRIPMGESITSKWIFVWFFFFNFDIIDGYMSLVKIFFTLLLDFRSLWVSQSCQSLFFCWGGGGGYIFERRMLFCGTSDISI